MAGEQVTVVIVEVQAGPFAVAPHLTVFALAFLGPAAVAHYLEAVLPDLPEVVLIDIALVHVAAYRGTAADAAVAADAGHFDTTAAIEEMVADFLFVLSEETFAGITDIWSLFYTLLRPLRVHLP